MTPYDDNMVDLASGEFVVGVAAILVAALIVYRFLPPLARFLVLVGFAAWSATTVFEVNEVRPIPIVMTIILIAAAYQAWRKDVRGRPEVHRNTIFGFLEVRHKEHDNDS